MLLCFGQQKKVVLLPETADRAAVVAAASEYFNLSNVVIQHFDADFDEWVDLEEDYTPSNKEKLQVLLRDAPEALTISEDVEVASSLDDLVSVMSIMTVL